MRREGRIFPESFSFFLFLLGVGCWALGVERWASLFCCSYVFVDFAVSAGFAGLADFADFVVFVITCFFPESFSLLTRWALGFLIFSLFLFFLKFLFFFPSLFPSSFSVCFDTRALPCLINSVQIATPRATKPEEKGQVKGKEETEEPEGELAILERQMAAKKMQSRA